jgi:hypothetical protein
MLAKCQGYLRFAFELVGVKIGLVNSFCHEALILLHSRIPLHLCMECRLSMGYRLSMGVSQHKLQHKLQSFVYSALIIIVRYHCTLLSCCIEDIEKRNKEIKHPVIPVTIDRKYSHYK